MNEPARYPARHRLAGILLGWAMILAVVPPAFAQRNASRHEPHGFYVSATVFGDIERFSQDSTDLTNGQTEGLGIGIGTFVTPQWSLEFEASGRRFITSEPLMETHESAPGGINTILERRTQTRHRMDTGVVLLAFHPSVRGRVRLAYSAGLSFVRLQRELTYDEIYSESGSTSAYHYASVQTDLLLAPVLQIEASVRLSRRVALVPYFRAAAFDVANSYSGGAGAFVFQPGVAIRAGF